MTSTRHLEGSELAKQRTDRTQRAAEIIERLEQAHGAQELSRSRLERQLRRLDNLADEAVPLLLDKLRSPDRHARRFAATMLIELGDESLPERLREMLDDPSLSSAQQSDILPLLHILGEPPDDETLRRVMPHPGRHLEQSIATLLEDIEMPESAESFLQSIEVVESDVRATFVRDVLVSRADRRLLPLFAALLHYDQHDVVMAAIDGLERVKEPATIPLLKERARYDPSPQVRRAAESAYLRLEVRAADREPTPWFSRPRFPLDHNLVTTIDGSGGQVLLMCRRMPSGDFHVLDLLFNDHEGLKDCFGFHADGPTIGKMIDGFRPIEFVDVSAEHSHLAVEEARQTALRTFRRLPPAFMLYQAWLEEDDETGSFGESPLPLLEPALETARLLESEALLGLGEFESWYFNPDEVEDFVERYSQIPDRLAEEVPPALHALLREAIETILDTDYCTLLVNRLRRQAWLLAQIYEDEDAPLWALAAARGIEQGTVAEHPLLLGMMESSLINAYDLD